MSMEDYVAANNRYASHLAEFDGDREQQLTGHRIVREAFAQLEATLMAVLPQGRHYSLVVTKLEEAAMWANKAVASPYPIHPDHVVGTQGSGVESRTDIFNRTAALGKLNKDEAEAGLRQTVPVNWPRHDVEELSRPEKFEQVSDYENRTSE